MNVNSAVIDYSDFLIIKEKWDDWVAGIPDEEKYLRLFLSGSKLAFMEDGTLLIVFKGENTGKRIEFITGSRSLRQQAFLTSYLAEKLGKPLLLHYAYIGKHQYDQSINK